MDVAILIERLVPAAKYRGSVTANDKAAFDGLIWEDDRSKPTWAEIVAVAIEVAKDQKKAAINAFREEKISLGVPYVFPDGQSGVIQTRDQIDIRNIQTNVLNAMALSGQAVTLQFRDEADVTHAMTPAQMIEMGIAVGQRGNEIYVASWGHKNAIEELTTAAEIDAYDFTTGWPVE